MAPPAPLVRVGVATAAVIAIAIGLSGCAPGSPQDAAWRPGTAASVWRRRT